jgi:hypothetical protein
MFKFKALKKKVSRRLSNSETDDGSVRAVRKGEKENKGRLPERNVMLAMSSDEFGIPVFA